MSMSSSERLDISILGDVCLDKAFIANEPAPGKYAPSPSNSPWELFSSGYSFTIPGGAWLTGHMVQAALEGPLLHETFKMVLSEGVELLFEGCFETTTDSIVHFLMDKAVALTFESKSGRRTRKIKNMNMSFSRRAVLELRADVFAAKIAVQSGGPGSAAPNQMNRRFGLTRCLLEPMPTCSFVEIVSSKGTIELQELDGESLASDVHYVAIGMQSNTDNSFQLRDRDNKGIEFEHATVEVIHGKAKFTHEVTDWGKLNSEQHILKVSKRKDLISFTKSSVPQLHQNVDGRDKEPDQIFFYACPDNNLTAIKPREVLRIYNSLDLFPMRASDAANNVVRVFRRSATNGVERPVRPSVLERTWDNLQEDDCRSQLLFGQGATKRIVIIDDDGLGFAQNARFWQPFLIPYDDRLDVGEFNRRLDLYGSHKLTHLGSLKLSHRVKRGHGN